MSTVVTRPENLQGDQEVGEFVLWKLYQLATRPLIIWAFFAIFFPALGVTYLMALAGIIALASVRGVPNRELVHAIRRTSERRAAKAKVAKLLAKL